MTAAYLTDDQLTGSVTFYQGMGVDMTTFTSDQRANLIAQSSRKIDGFLRDTMAQTVATEYYRGTGTNFLRLRHYPLWAGLKTTLSAPVASGDTVAHLASVAGLLAGQLLVWDDGHEGAIPVAGGYAPGGTTVPLAAAATAAHAAGATVHVNPIDFINIILPGGSVFPLPIVQLVIEPQQGTVQNYTPLMFQQLGYSTIFPRDVPLQAQYTYGFVAGSYPDAVVQTCLELCVSTVARLQTLAASGTRMVRSGDVMIRFDWDVPELTAEQQRRLGPFVRGRGIY